MPITRNIVIIMLSIALLQSCCRENNRTYLGSKPVYLSYADLRNSVASTAPAPMKNPGKLYFKDNYIYINEKYEGIHIIDNANPASPNKIGFIKIPGNVDLAIKGNYLYADNAVDLVVIDISNPQQTKVVKRINEIFPYGMPGNLPHRAAPVDRTKGVVIGWKDTLITESSPCN